MQIRYTTMAYVALVVQCLSGCGRQEGEHLASLNSIAQLSPTDFILQTTGVESMDYLLHARDMNLTRLSDGPSRSTTHEWSLSTIHGSDGVVCYYTRVRTLNANRNGQVLILGINGHSLELKSQLRFPQAVGTPTELVWLSPNIFIVAQRQSDANESESTIQIGFGKAHSEDGVKADDVVLHNTTLQGMILNLTRCDSSSGLLTIRDSVGGTSSVKLSLENSQGKRNLVVNPLPSALSSGPIMACPAPATNAVFTITGENLETLNVLSCWDPASWQKIRSAKLSEPVRQGVLAISPTAKLAAAELRSKQAIGVINTNSGKTVGVIAVEDRKDRKRGDYEAAVASMHFIDDDTLLVVQLNGVVKRCDIKNPSETVRKQLTSSSPVHFK